MLRKIIYIIMILLLGGMVTPVSALEPVKIKSAWMAEYESFPLWYAKQKGWDKEVGLDVTMFHFDSGQAIMDGMDAYKWVIAGCGAVPTIKNLTDKKLLIVAVGSEEAATNALFCRKDSPILEQRRIDSRFPATYGSQETIRNSTILCPRGSSAHYLLKKWLTVFNLSEKDVRLRYMEPSPALVAFSKGVGDIVGLWGPRIHEAIASGFKRIATAREFNLVLPTLILVKQEFAQTHPDVVVSFLKMYMRSIELVRSIPPEHLAEEYIRFSKERAQAELTIPTAVRDLTDYRSFTLKEQLDLFKNKEKLSEIQKILLDIATFYNHLDLVDENASKAILSGEYTTDKFLRMIQ